MFSPKIKQLIDALQQLPSIGPKSAQRLVFHLLKQQQRKAGLNIAACLEAAMLEVNICERCRTYTENSLCRLCDDASKRNAKILCVVESPMDVYAVEQTGVYQGLYFVLQGFLSPLDNVTPDDIGLPLLFQRLHSECIQELIISTNPTVEGEATAHYIAQHTPPALDCTRLAYGIPIGSELEYLDHYTLRHALNSRMSIVENNPQGE